MKLVGVTQWVSDLKTYKFHLAKVFQKRFCYSPFPFLRCRAFGIVTVARHRSMAASNVTFAWRGSLKRCFFIFVPKSMSNDSMISQEKLKVCWREGKRKGIKPSLSEGVIPLLSWCPKRESNSHSHKTEGF